MKDFVYNHDAQTFVNRDFRNYFMSLNMYLKKHQGFTITELTVVVSILALLVTIAVPILLNQISRAKIAAHNANISVLESSARLAIAVKGFPPTNIQWPDVDGTNEAGYELEKYIAEWPSLPEGLTYNQGFLGGSTVSYEVIINTNGTIEVSPAKET
ncbi:MAG: prepilin-type N-terminal cleavage/methylation domain-containing protein [Clostridia bacterium]|nr:prepilin-type N-terminal cleavage/methylation domain-containing protein [Clostridia bacterium]